MHPSLWIVIVLIFTHIFQRIVDAGRHQQMLAKVDGIGVVLVVPPGADAEEKLNVLLGLAANPSAVRFYVAKLCNPEEFLVELRGVKVRLATRIHYVRSRNNKSKLLLPPLMQEVMEPYVLCVHWDHEVDWGWDDVLTKQWMACQNKNAILSTRLANQNTDVGFICVESFQSTKIILGRSLFSHAPPSPQPSIACSTQLIFGPSVKIQRAWPRKNELASSHLDATVTAFLWMRGLNFYCPSICPFYCKTRNETQEEAAPVCCPSSALTRTHDEFWMSLGIRNGQLSSRSKAGLTLKASKNERYYKTGQAIALRRDL